MDDSTLNSIIGDENISTESIASTVNTDDGTLHCDEPGCDASFSGVMAKAQLGRHKSAKHGIHNTTAKKSSVSKVENLNQIPTSQSYLEELLAGYNVPARNGILLSIKDDPENIDELGEALKSVRVDKNTADFIIKKYAKSVGKNISTEPIIQKEPDAIDDILARKKKEADLKLYDSFVQGNQNQKQDSGEISRLTQMIADMQRQQGEQQRQFNEKLVEHERKYTEQLEKQRQQQELLSLKEELRAMRERSDQQIGSLSGTMSEFAKDITGSMEKYIMERDFHRKEDELKKEIEVVKANSNKSLNEKVIDKVENLVNSTGAGFAGIARENIGNERALLLSNLLSQGIPYPQAMQAITGRAVPSAEQEYRNLAKITSEIEQEKKAAIPQPPEKLPEPEPEVISPVKFNVGD